MTHYLVAGAVSGNMTSIIMIVAMIAIFYFMLMRPQKKEQQRKDAMLAAMSVGDTALTTSGFYGTIIDIQDDMVIVEFGNNRNCRIPMQKAAVVAVEKPQDAANAEYAKSINEKPEKKGLFGKSKATETETADTTVDSSLEQDQIQD